MLYALLGDLHSNTKNTKSVLQQIKQVEPTATIIGLGDLYECTVGKKKARTLMTTIPLEEAAIVKKKFEKLLTFPSMIGNQELRIAKVTGDKRCLNYPDQIEIEHATLIHGHQFEFDWENNYALLSYPPLHTPVVFFGHSHAPAIYKNNARYSIQYNRKIDVSNGQYFVNVGAVTVSCDWLLYDSEQMTITFMQAT